MQAVLPPAPQHIDLADISPGAEVLRRIAANKHKRWGDLNEDFAPHTAVARLLPPPIPDIKITPKFTIPATAKVFTIGSCFARHLEICLQKKGVTVLSRNYAGIPAEVCETNASQVFNKYNPSSILDQFTTSLEDPQLGEQALLQLGDDAWYDLSSCTLKPCPLETARAIQDIQTRAFAAVRNADIVVITLGLTETWIDLQTGRACNRPPPLNKLKGDNGRFGFYNHDVATTTKVLRSIIGLLRGKLGSTLKILFTVSPVPLQSTFTANDVIVANCYSKSVLRAAVTPVVEGDPNLEYFPSYELVTLTDVALAWERDRRHVRMATVDAVIGKFMANYLVG
jgi:hypothetical protein